jgi:Raf kinase inhibitor-like YbhB/YbcL family protein
MGFNFTFLPIGQGTPDMSMRITSPAFAAGAAIPKRYSGEGEDVSPPLSWQAVPQGTQELAIICDDPDAPSVEPWVHWVIYRIPPQLNHLPEHLSNRQHLDSPVALRQGRNSWTSGPKFGYRGPMPPVGHGTHHYHFRLYALDAALELEPGCDRSDLVQAMQGHILSETEIVGTYAR